MLIETIMKEGSDISQQKRECQCLNTYTFQKDSKTDSVILLNANKKIDNCNPTFKVKKKLKERHSQQK
jgi:hypothetical protein